MIAIKLKDRDFLLERNVQLKENFSLATHQLESMEAKALRLNEAIKQACVSRRKWRKARIEIALMAE